MTDPSNNITLELSLPELHDNLATVQNNSGRQSPVSVIWNYDDYQQNYKDNNNNKILIEDADQWNDKSFPSVSEVFTKDCSIDVSGGIFTIKHKEKFLGFMGKTGEDWLIAISIVQYEYNHFHSINSIFSIIIIILSAVLTLLEAIKTSKTEHIIATTVIIIGFFISLIASLMKYFNLQQKMETLKTLIDNLDHCYIEGNILYTTLDNHINYYHKFNKCYNNDMLSLMNDEYKSYWEDWRRISKNGVSPYSQITKVIDPLVCVIHLRKFLKRQLIEDRERELFKFNKHQGDNYWKNVKREFGYPDIMGDASKFEKLHTSNIKKFTFKYASRYIFG
jgi:hypothetical protein